MYVFQVPASSHRPITYQDAAAPCTVAAMFGGIPEEQVAPGQAIAWQGEPATSVTNLTSGVLRMFRLLPDGRRMITRFLFPGDVIGLSDKGCFASTVEAVTAATIVRCGRNRFESTLEAFPSLHREFVTLLMAEIEAADEHLLLLGRKTAEERVASFLLLLAGHQGQFREPAVPASALTHAPVQIVVPMGRQDIADYLGLTLETVCRAMTSFKRLKLIKVWGRRQIWLRDPAVLADFASGIQPDTDHSSY